MKKTLLTLGVAATIVTPLATVISCGTTKTQDETYRGNLKEGKQLKFLTLGDSVAHGDYTFQMKGSGTEYMPMIDGPARAASYQDYIIDELQRDGLVSKNDVPNYKTSASGIRTDELANWLEMDNFKSAMDKSNPTDKPRVDSHLHPYTEGSQTKSVYSYGHKGTAALTETPFNKVTQQDQVKMSDHIKNSDVIMITIGGNDILKNLKILGVPYPSLGETSISEMIKPLLGGLSTPGLFDSMPSVKSAFAQILNPSFLKNIGGVIAAVKSSLADISKAATTLPAVLAKTVLTLKGLFTNFMSITPEDQVKFEQWFLKGGYKSFVSVDSVAQQATMTDIKNNLKRITTKISDLNPKAKVIFTGYPSPMLHLPKIIRNLAMPIYGQLGQVTEELAKEEESVYYAPSSLQNWETDDPKDIYKNILADPHPTLEGQGVMARDILNVIDDIYGFKSKITDKEIETHTAQIVEAHKNSGAKLTEAQIDNELSSGSIKQPYVTDGIYHEDIDYAYGVKRLALEEINHAKIYVPSRLINFLIDALTESITLNQNVEDPKDQSAPVSGNKLSLADFTTKWSENYLEYVKQNPGAKFVEPLKLGYEEEVKNKFEKSLKSFIDGFKSKIGQDIEEGKVLEDALDKIQSTLMAILSKH